MHALRGDPVARVPAWLLFPYHRLGCYVDVRTHPAYRPVAEAARTLAVTLNRRHAGVALHAPEVAWEHADAVRAFLDRVMIQKRIVYRWCLERELADVYFLVGSELASPPLVSRATFRLEECRGRRLILSPTPARGRLLFWFDHVWANMYVAAYSLVGQLQ